MLFPRGNEVFFTHVVVDIPLEEDSDLTCVRSCCGESLHCVIFNLEISFLNVKYSHVASHQNFSI